MKIFNWTIAFLSLICLTIGTYIGISHLPETSELASTTKKDLDYEVSQVLSSLEKKELTKYSCSVFLNTLSNKITQESIDNYDLKLLEQNGKSLIQKLWSIRLLLRDDIQDLPQDCIKLVRNLSRQIRSLEDYIGDISFKTKSELPEKIKFDKQPIPILENHPAYETLYSPKYSPENFHFQSGDVMLTRGMSFLSATISNIDDIPSQYSHFVLVHSDPKTQKVHTIESYVGKGVILFDLKDALKFENARILVLRPKDSVIGKKAAEFMYQKVKTRIDKSEKPIPYDYKMNFEDHSAVSCAEVGRYGYEVGSDKKLILPYIHSTVSIQDEDFLSSIGVRRGEIFEPADMEVDPRFEVVLEWRDYRVLRDSRHKDMIVREMFRWMNDHQYRLRETGESFLAKNLIWVLRKTPLWPLFRWMGLPDFSKEIPRASLGAMTQLNQIGEILLSEVQKADEEFIKQSSRPLSTYQIAAFLEQLRAQDLEDFKKGGPSMSKFHFALRPTDVEYFEDETNKYSN